MSKPTIQPIGYIRQIDNKGRVAIPIDVLTRKGIKPGAEVTFLETKRDGEIIVRVYGAKS